MKWIFGRTGLWLFTTVAMAAVAFATGQDVLPEGEGKKIVANACTVCHGLEQITDGQMTKEEWTQVVSDMVKQGAVLDSKETPIVVDYLAKNFGPKGSQAAGQPAQAPAGEGKALLESRCTACHDLDLVESEHMDKDGWQGVVDSMKGKGAELSDKETITLVDYLVATHGPK